MLVKFVSYTVVFVATLACLVIPYLYHASLADPNNLWESAVSGTWNLEYIESNTSFFFVLVAAIMLVVMQVFAGLTLLKVSKLSSNRGKLLALVRWTVLLVVVAIANLAVMSYSANVTRTECSDTEFAVDATVL